MVGLVLADSLVFVFRDIWTAVSALILPKLDLCTYLHFGFVCEGPSTDLLHWTVQGSTEASAIS